MGCVVAGLLVLLALAAPAAGEWVVADDYERLCKEKNLCTGSNFTWATPHTFGSEDSCALLARKGVREMRLYGDSFMRHLYVALTLTLTGNYKDGALQDGITGCDYDLQFAEMKCRRLLNFTMTLCDGAVKFKYAYGNPPLQSVMPPLCPLHAGWKNWVSQVCEQPLPDTLTLWTIGNHPVNGDYVTHYGQNSAPHHVEYMRSGEVCPFAVEHPDACRLWWVTTHQRLNHVDHGLGKPTEPRSQIRDFNVGMREFFEAGGCGPGHVVDVYNMTERLVEDLEDEAVPLTYDSFHWSTVVNLIKAQIVFNEMEAALLDADPETPEKPGRWARGEAALSDADQEPPEKPGRGALDGAPATSAERAARCGGVGKSRLKRRSALCARPVAKHEPVLRAEESLFSSEEGDSGELRPSAGGLEAAAKQDRQAQR